MTPLESRMCDATVRSVTVESLITILEVTIKIWLYYRPLVFDRMFTVEGVTTLWKALVLIANITLKGTHFALDPIEGNTEKVSKIKFRRKN
jgi:cytochrome c oxidase assembly factor CtaG